MKKLILAATIAFTSLFTQANQRIVTYYTQPSQWGFAECDKIKAYFTLAVWAAKYTHFYTFDECDSCDCLVLLAYNEEASFFLRYDKNTDECVVEFNACDDSFSYCCFKKVLDSFFLYN